jgi:hypothetical protein
VPEGNVTESVRTTLSLADISARAEMAAAWRPVLALGPRRPVWTTMARMKGFSEGLIALWVVRPSPRCDGTVVATHAFIRNVSAFDEESLK